MASEGDGSASEAEAMAFILEIHHELRNSSAGAMGYAQLLAEGQPGFASDEQERIIQEMYAAVQKIESLQKQIHTWLLARRP